MSGRPYATLEFTQTFLDSFASRDLTAAERKLFLKAMRLLDQDVRHPSLRVHQLRGDRAESWSAAATSELRMTFERLPDGGLRMLTCSRHHDR